MLAVPRRPRPDLFRTETLMIFGMTYLTFVHVLLSLIGILAGLVVLLGLLTSKQLPGWTAVFIWTTGATSVTGFLFPFHRFLPSHEIDIISLGLLATALYPLYAPPLPPPEP